MTDRRPSDPIEELCALASREQWCWNLSCRTCGHELFRFALKDLAAGRRPGEPDWRVYTKMVRALREDPGIKMAGASWDHHHQKTLSGLASGLRIDAVAAQCRFPDWLGYLGIVLDYTDAVERESRSLTLAWTPQLIGQLHDGPLAAHLQSVLDDPSRRLQPQDLERVELSLRNRRLS